MKKIALKKILNNNEINISAAAGKRRAANLAAGFALAMVSAGPAFAGPTGGQVVGGEGTISQGNNLTQIDQFSQQVSINWETFNVATNETVRFVQPDSTSVALNTIFDQNASQIFGTIDANGRVLLINPNGMIFAPTAQVNVAGLVASSLNLSTADFMAGNYNFESSGAGGVVLNQGTLQAAPGGFIALLGEAVSNEGLIVADAGTIAMGSGSSVALDFDGSGLIYFEVESEILDTALDVDAAVNNSGSLFADGGQVLLTSRAAQDVFTRAINNDGIVQARRISNEGGVIRLSASSGEVVSSGTLDAAGDDGSTGGSVSLEGEKVGVAGGAVVNADGGTGGGTILVGGDVQGGGQMQAADYAYVGNGADISADALDDGDGGTVVVWAEETARVYGDISARGGATSGDGGFVETSGKGYLDFAGTVDASAANGEAGTWLLDPEDIDIVNANANITQGGDATNVTFTPTAADTTTTIDVAAINTALSNGSNVNISTTSAGTTTDGDITVSAAIAKSGDTGGDGSTLVLDADNDIVVNQSISSTVGELNVDLQADGAIDINANVTTNGGSFTTANAANTSFDSTGATIDTSGATNQDGGAVTIDATGAVIAAAIDSSAGADNDDSGQDGGAVSISGSTVSTAAITTSGSAASGGGTDGDGGAVSMTAASGITLNGNISTAAGGASGSGGAVDFNNAVTLGATVTVDSGATGGNVSFDDTVNAGTAYTEGLTVTAGTGNVAFSGAVGGTAALGDVSITSAGSVDVDGAFNAASLASTSASFDSAGVTIDTAAATDDDAGAVNLSATGAVIAGTIDASAGTDSNDSGHTGGAVTLAGASVSAGAITTTGSAATGGGTDGAGGDVSLTANSTSITLNGNINTAGGDTAAGGAVALNSPVTLAANTSINTGATGGGVTFGDTVNASTAYTEGLTVTAGTGNVAFSGAVGGTAALGDVSITSAGSVNVDGAFNAASLASTSASFDSAGVTIDTAAATDDDAGAVNISATGAVIAGTIDGSAGTDSNDSGHTGGAVTLAGSSVSAGAITTTGSAATGGGADGAGGDVSLTANSTSITLNGNINTAGGDTAAGGAVALNSPVTLAGNTSINTGATGGGVTFGDTVNASTAYTEGLTVTAGTGNVAFSGAVGGTAALGDVSITSAGSVDVGGAFNAASLASTSASFDSAGVTIDTAAADDDDAGAVNVSATGAVVAGAIDASAGTDSDNSGHTGGAVTLAGASVSAGAITTTGSEATGGGTDGAGGTVSLTASSTSITLNGNIDSAGGDSADGGDVIFNSPVILAGNTTIDTGATGGNIAFGDTVDGTTAFADTLGLTAGTGNVAFNGEVGGTAELGAVTVNSATDVDIEAAFAAASLTSTNSTTFDSAGASINTTPDSDSAGGTIQITTSGALIAGNLVTTGGADADGSGNAGGVVTLQGDSVTVGAVTTTGTSAMGGGSGGSGGNVELTADSTTITLGGDIDTSGGDAASGGNVTLNDAVVLSGGNRSIDTGAGGGAVEFNSSLDGGTNGLTVTAGSGQIDFEQASDLAFLDASTSGNLNINNDVTTNVGSSGIALQADTIDIDGNRTLDSNDEAISLISNSLNDGANSVIDAGTGVVTLAPLDTSSTIDVCTSGCSTYDLDSYEITASTVQIGRAGQTGDIDVGTTALVGSENYNVDFVNEDGDININGPLSTTAANRGFSFDTTNGIIDLDNNVTTDAGDITFASNVELAGPSETVSTGAGAGNVDFQGTINGASNLTVSAGSGQVDLGSVGGGTALSSLDVNTTGNVNLGGNITAAGDVELDGTIQLGGNDIAIDSNSGDAGGTISLADNNGQVYGGGSLTLTAGTGDVALGPVGQDGNLLSGLTVTSADEVDLNGSVSTDTAANGGTGMVFDAASVTLANTITLNSGGTDISFATDNFSGTGATINAGTTGIVALSPSDANLDLDLTVCDSGIGGSCNGGGPGEYDVGSLTAVTAQEFQIGRAEHTGDITLNAADPAFDLGLRNGSGGEIIVDGAFNGQGLSVTSGSAGIDVNASITAASGNNNDVTLDPGSGEISLGASIVTNGNDAVFAGDVVLDGNVTVNSSDAGGDGDVDFQGSINSPTNRSLTVNADTDGTVNLGQVGQDTDSELSTLTVTGNTINLGGNIETSGNIAINGQKNMLADLMIDTGTGAGSVNLSNGATSDGAETFDLEIVAGDGAITLGETTVGSVSASTTNQLNIEGHITTSDVNSSTGNGIGLAGGTVALGTANGLDPTAGYDLVSNNQPIEILADNFTDSDGSDINAGSSTVTIAPLTAGNSISVCDEADNANDCAAGAATEIDLGSYSISASAVQIGRAGQTGDISTSALTGLGYDLALDTQGEATIGAAYNSQALSVNADTGITLSGNVTTNGDNASFADDVTLTSDVQVNTGAGNASFQGEVDGGQALTVSATSGNVDVGNVGTNTALTSFSVTSATGSIELGGDITTTGDVLLSGTKVLSTDVVVDNSSGAGSVTMSPGDISNTDSESLTVNGGTGGVTLAGVSVNALNVTTTGSASVGAIDNTGDVDISAGTIALNGAISGNNVDLAAATGNITLPQVDADGALSVAAAGDIVGNSAVAVSGAAAFDAGGNVTLDNAASVFGSVDLTATNATVVESDATTIAGANVSGNLSVDSGGAITDSGSLTVGGTADLDANGGAADITLNDAGSTYGTLSLSAGNATIVEDDGTDLGASNVNGNLVLTSGGDITDSGTIVVGGNASLSTDTGSIVLDQPLSTFGSLTLDAGSASVIESGDMSVNGADIDGSLALESSGDMSVNGADVGGNLALESSGDIVGTGLQATTSLTMSANGEIDVQTTVDSIALTNDGAGDVDVDESDDLQLDVITPNGAGSSLTVNADGNIVQSENISTNNGSVTIVANGGSLTMGETAETSTSGGDITYRTTGEGNDITLGLLKTCEDCNVAGETGAILVEAGGDILGQPRQGDQPHITGVTAFLRSGGQIGSDPEQGGQQVVFDNMAEDSDANPEDDEVAPIHLEAPNDSFVNTNFFFVTSSGRIFNQSEGDRATAASAQAAALEEEEDVDWAAYSEDITVYEINNEGIQLPDAGEVDEFVMIEDDGNVVPAADDD